MFSTRAANFTAISAAVIGISLIGGCGGGGGVSTTSASNSSQATPPASSLATSVPVPTYAADSVEKSLFDQLNVIRLSGGFGMLSQDPSLDTAAQNHASYVKTNYATPVNSSYFVSPDIYLVDAATGWLNAHVEKAGLPGFTGILPVNRIAAAGASYAYSGEVMAFNSHDTCLSGELDTVFHRGPLLSPMDMSIGMGFVDLGTSYGVCVFEPGYKTSPSRPPSGWIGVYPGDRQLRVPTGMPRGEAPDPAPEIPNATKGYPISVYLNDNIRSVDTFTVTAVGASTATPVKLIMRADFPAYLSASEAHILPKQPLAAATTFNVVFKGTNVTGQSVEKSWSFSTL